MRIYLALPPPYKPGMSAEDWIAEAERSIAMGFRKLQMLFEGKIDTLNMRRGGVEVGDLNLYVDNAIVQNNSEVAQNDPSTATNQATTAVNQAQVTPGHVHYPEVASSATAAIVSAEDLTQSAPITCTLAGQPDYPRNVTLTITDDNASITAFQVTVTGVLADGRTDETEVFTQAGGLQQTGSRAFARITSVIVDSISGAGAGDVLSVGTGNKIGLPAKNLAAVYKTSVDHTDEAVGTVNTEHGTVQPSSLPDGVRVYDFWYTQNHTHQQDSHNHLQDQHNHSQQAHNHSQIAHNHDLISL